MDAAAAASSSASPCSPRWWRRARQSASWRCGHRMPWSSPPNSCASAPPWPSSPSSASSTPASTAPRRRGAAGGGAGGGAAAAPLGVLFVVMAIDVDNLKPVNDEYGHEAGDLVLRTAAQVITEIARSGDIIARVGGDEFAVVLLALAPAEAMAVGERMRAAMHGASIPRGRVRISVGIAIGEAGGDAHEVWREADAALLQAKREGGDRVALPPGSLTHIFEPSRLTATI